MTSASTLLRSVLIYSICLPLAVFLGYLMATPLDYTTYVSVGLVLALLASPLFLRWHHIWLIAAWNLGAVLFFLPGRPAPWMFMALVSLFIAVLQYILNRRLRFLYAPQVARPLIFLLVVVVVTAKCTGGIGLGMLGSEMQGGKRYFLLVSAIIGYFALTSRAIDPRRAGLCVALFFLGSLANAVGELAPVIAPSLYFIFLLFPVSSEALASVTDTQGASANAGIMRLGGLAGASIGILCAMLASHGIQQLFTWRRIGRLSIFLFFAAISLLGGYRSNLIILMLTFAFVFYFEGLMRSRLLPLFIFLLVSSVALLVPLADRLPLSMQRTLSFLPIPVDPVARRSADDTTEWRLELWRHLLPQIPHYLILGKGYSFSATEMAEIHAVAGRGTDSGMESFEMAGDYHNGPLSVILPLGLFGVFGFIWFLVASIRALHQNQKFGLPEYRHYNTLFLAYFITRTIFFFTIFGSFYGDLFMFTGIVGMSISLNGGVAKPELVPQAKIRFHAFKLQPVARRRIGAW